MNRTILVRRAFALSCALVLAAAGCELAVDFDRTKIDAGSIDASIADVVAIDSPSTTTRDSGPDVAVDAPTDAPIDAPLDTLADVTTDANTPDVEVEAGTDAAADAPDDADDSG